MSTKHKPDLEMEIMRRAWRDIASLGTAGRRRVLAYLSARIETTPPPIGDGHAGEQQLDIEEALPVMPATRGAVS
jgi:hypothetical protein